ncbi:MAG TPA: hypothetical protein VJ905_06675 [Halalkalibaculum sp.]|nr:hypothetical protein [Halalkalibaculum sp.]
MENLDGTTLFWLVTVGMLIGAAAKVVMWNKGLTITTNIIAGVLGTVIVGGIGIELQVPGSMMFGVLGGLAILFIANVFFLQDEHEAPEH